MCVDKARSVCVDGREFTLMHIGCIDGREFTLIHIECVDGVNLL